MTATPLDLPAIKARAEQAAALAERDKLYAAGPGWDLSKGPWQIE